MVRHGLAFDMPGFQCGIIFTTLSASLSSIGFTDLCIFGEAMLPSLFIINDTTTLPSILGVQPRDISGLP